MREEKEKEMQCHTCHVNLSKHACSQCLVRTYCSEKCANFDWYSNSHYLYCGPPMGAGNTLQSLKNRLPADVRDRNPNTVDGWLALRRTLAAVDSQLQREIDAYRVTQDEVENHLEDVVFLSNLTSMGPMVMPSPGKGYGLFADKRYKGSLDDRGEYVTTYGGTLIDANNQGPYVLSINKDFVIDGFYGFALIDKGRWINSDNDEFNAYFLRNQVHVYTSEYEQRRAPRIEKGTEFLINYGDEYEGSWEESSSIEVKRRKPSPPQGSGTNEDPYVIS